MTYKQALKKQKPFLLFEPVAHEFYYMMEDHGELCYLLFSVKGFSRTRFLSQEEWDMRIWKSATEEPIVDLEIARIAIKDVLHEWQDLEDSLR